MASSAQQVKKMGLKRAVATWEQHVMLERNQDYNYRAVMREIFTGLDGSRYIDTYRKVNRKRPYRMLWHECCQEVCFYCGSSVKPPTRRQIPNMISLEMN